MKPVQRTNPLKPDEAKKWYPVQYTTKMVDENEVTMLIADETALNPMRRRWRYASCARWCNACCWTARA